MSLLELNKGDNFIWALDVSRSMGQTDCPGGMSRINFSKETIKSFIGESAKYDPDGSDLYTFGAHVTPIGMGLTPEKAGALIDKLEANEGSTDTAAVVRAMFKRHREGGYEQTVGFIATDGEPNDEEALFQEIARITQELKNEHEFALQFLTAGVRSPGLQAFLTKLDDDIPGAKYDIVDVKALEGATFSFADAVDGALHD